MAKKKKTAEKDTNETVEKSTDKEVKATRSKLHPADKKFIDISKLLFSSLSMRTCVYAYFNVIDNGFILANSTKPPIAKKNAVLHDRLTEFADSDLTLHFVELKDKEYWDRLRKLCGVPERGVWCLLAANALKQITTVPLEKLTIVKGSSSGISYLASSGTALNTLSPKVHGVGISVTDFHVLSNLYKSKDELLFTESEEFKQCPHASVTLPVMLDTLDREYTIDFELANLKRPDGSQVFLKKHRNIHLEAIDGIDGVSYREFIKKIANKDYTYEVNVWVTDDSYLSRMFCFENEWVRVRTLRPNVILIPLDSDIPLSDRNLLNVLEDTNDARSS